MKIFPLWHSNNDYVIFLNNFFIDFKNYLGMIIAIGATEMKKMKI